MRKEYDDRKNDTTASRVRVLREKNGLTQQELADKIGITNSQISRLESGKTKNISSFILVLCYQGKLPPGAQGLEAGPARQ